MKGMPADMTGSFLGDAFAHHVWATARLIDECSTLTTEQLERVVEGTYGSIIGTLRHLVSADRWYLTFFPDTHDLPRLEEEAPTSLSQLRSELDSSAQAWARVLATRADPEADVPESGDDWEFHAPLSFRLAQAIHHGTDHRSQVCSALTVLGRTPPEIDVWAYGEATGRSREVG
jgi:uncharacterized damage-inducible protein DinB